MIRRLAGHSAIYTFANLASRGTMLVWLIVLPSFLSPADYGALGLIVTVAALVLVMVPLEISQALARYFPPAEPADQVEYVRTAWTFTLAMLTASTAAALVFAAPACELLLGSREYLPAFRIAIAFFLLNTIFYFIQNQLRWEFRPRDYTLVTLVFAIVTLTASVLLAALSPDALIGVLVGQLVGAGAGVALGLFVLRRSLAIGFVSSKLRQMLRFSLPLVSASFALFVSTYASRFILSDMLDLREVGIFTWASQLAAIPALLLLGVQGAITPLVMKHQADPEIRTILARLFEAIIAVELLLCLSLGAFTPELVAVLGYSDFADAAPLVMIVAPAIMMMQVYIFSPGFAIAERTDLQLAVSAVSAIAAVLLNLWLIGMFGLVGAAMATLAGGALFISGWFTLSQRLYPLPAQWLKLATFVLPAAMGGWTLALMGNSSGIWEVALKLGVLLAVAIAALLLRLLRFSDLRSAASMVAGRLR